MQAESALSERNVSEGHKERKGKDEMSTIRTKDGTELYYKYWGTGRSIVFFHGWPLSADAWDAQMLFMAEKGYRVIAHDRRGHGRSSQPSNGNEMNTYADDLAALIDTLKLSHVTLVEHSTGGGEVARYLGRHGTARRASHSHRRRTADHVEDR